MVTPVDTSVKFMTSLFTNGATPVLSGVAGACIVMLDKFLLPIGSGGGWDPLTVTITVSGGVAAITFPSLHSSQSNSIVNISGVTGGATNATDLNGEQKITGRINGSLFAAFNCPTVGNGTITGTITCQMAPQGQWAKVFASGTTLASYQSTDTGFGSKRFFLDVDDSNAQYVKVRAYEAMTAVGTGTNPFPTVAQVATSTWVKSNVASSAAVPFAIFADSRAIHFHAQYGFTTANTIIGGATRFFGDLIDFRTGGDPYACALNFSTQVTGVALTPDNTMSARASTLYIARPYTGVGAATSHQQFGYSGNASGFSGLDAYFGAYPNQVDGLLRMCKQFQQVPTSLLPRSETPGFYCIPHSAVADSFRFGAIVNGSGSAAGKKLFTINDQNGSMSAASSTANLGTALIDITGPWR